MNPKNGEVGTYDPHSAGAVKPEHSDKTQEQIMQEKIEAAKKTPQFLAREEMAKRAEARRKSEDAEFRPDVIDDEGNITSAAPKPIEEQVPPEPAAEPIEQEASHDAALETAPTESEEPAKEEYKTLIVNGKEQLVPVSKILDTGIRALQKDFAADEKLAKASQLQRELEERLARFDRTPQGAEQVQGQQPQNAQPSDEDAALARAIQFGTEEEAKRAIAAVRNSGRGMNPADMRLFVERALEQKTAEQWVKSEYGHIFSKPKLTQLFMLEETNRRKAGDMTPTKELYKNIAQEIETEFQLQRAEAIATTPAAQPQAQDRLTRKMNAPKPVTGAAGRAPAPAPAKTPTLADYIQKRRQQNGQSPVVKGI